MNFPRGISASFAQFGSCFPVDRADKLIAKIYPAASMDVTPIALEVYGTCSQLPWEATLRPPSRRYMWSLRRPPQQMPLIAPNMRNLRRTFAKNPQPPALWNPSASTIEEAQNGLRLRLPSSEVQIATAHIQTAANVST